MSQQQQQSSFYLFNWTNFKLSTEWVHFTLDQQLRIDEILVIDLKYI